MNEQTRNELSAKLGELKIKEEEAWQAFKSAEKAFDEMEKSQEITEARYAVTNCNTTWLTLNKAVEGVKALLSMEGK